MHRATLLAFSLVIGCSAADGVITAADKTADTAVDQESNQHVGREIVEPAHDYRHSALKRFLPLASITYGGLQSIAGFGFAVGFGFTIAGAAALTLAIAGALSTDALALAPQRRPPLRSPIALVACADAGTPR